VCLENSITRSLGAAPSSCIGADGWPIDHRSILAAGPLAVDAFRPGNGGDERVRLTGLTAEAGFFRYGLGVTAGVDKVYGAQTLGTGVHVGVRAESYWAVAAIAVTGALYAIVWGPSVLRAGSR